MDWTLNGWIFVTVKVNSTPATRECQIFICPTGTNEQALADIQAGDAADQ